MQNWDIMAPIRQVQSTEIIVAPENALCHPKMVPQHFVVKIAGNKEKFVKKSKYKFLCGCHKDGFYILIQGALVQPGNR